MRKTLFAATAAVLIVAASTASAAPPDRSVTLSPASPTSSWEAAPSAFFNVAAPTWAIKCAEYAVKCDETLLEVTVPGGLTIDVRQHIGPLQPPYQGFRVRVLRSDAGGAPGPVVAQASNYGYSVTVSGAGLTAGYYLVEIFWDQGAGSFTSTATLTPKAAARRTD